MKHGRTLGLALAIASLPLVAQAEDKPAAPADPAPAAEALPEAAVKEAKDIYTARCAMCHGATGKGDGAASAALNPKPRDFGDTAWQKTITDQHIEKIIVEGGPAVGKSALMPPNPDLKDKGDVVKAIRAYVRSLAAAPAK